MAQRCTQALSGRGNHAARCASARGWRVAPGAHVLRQRSRGLRLRVNAGDLVTNATDATFEAEVLKSSVPVLVDFWATWCGPCKLVAPTMDWAAKEYGPGLKVVKVDADPNPKVIEQYKVQGLPTLLIFKDGQKVEGSQWEGAITRKQLVEYLEKHHVVPAVKATS